MNTTALSRLGYEAGEGQSSDTGVLKRDIFTSKGYNAFAPWNHPNFAKCLLQINMGQSAVGLMDVMNLGVLSNFSHQEFFFDGSRDKRYHYEKQPQFTDEVASLSFPSVYAALSRLRAPQFLLPPHQISDCNSALSLLGIYDVEGQSDSTTGVLIRDGFTSRGFIAFSPWNHPNFAKSLLQINLGHSAIGLMDVINLGVLSNFSNQEFNFSLDRDQRYHVEKQPQFTDEVASGSFFSVNAGLSRLNSPLFLLPPHQSSVEEKRLILGVTGVNHFQSSLAVTLSKRKAVILLI